MVEFYGVRAVWLGPWMLWRLRLVGALSVLGLRCGVWDMTYDGGLGLSALVSAGVFLILGHISVLF